MGETEDQDFTVQTKRNNIKKEYHHHNQRKDHHHQRKKKSRRYTSNIIFYTCDEKGHYSIDCPRNKGFSKKKSNNKIHHAHTIEDDEPTNKIFREEKEYSSSDKEYEFYW